MKKCEEYQEMISTYVDVELNDQETSKLFFHLGECSECRTMMKSMLQLRSLLCDAEVSTNIEHQGFFWKKKFTLSYPIAAVIVIMFFVSTILFLQKIAQSSSVVGKMQTEYVYMTSFPPVYARINPSTDAKSY